MKQARCGQRGTQIVYVAYKAIRAPLFITHSIAVCC